MTTEQDAPLEPCVCGERANTRTEKSYGEYRYWVECPEGCNAVKARLRHYSYAMWNAAMRALKEKV